MISITILLYVLLACSVIALILALRQLFKTRVWIEWRNHASQVLTTIGYVKAYSKDESAEIYNLDGEAKAAIGRVITDPKSTRLRGNIEVLMTSNNDDAAKPRYRRAGYVCFDQTTTIDEYGYIYKQIAGKKEREMIGYLARPSKPHTPTLHGERTWRTLWLRCTLCAYAGVPNPELDKQEKKSKSKRKEKQNKQEQQTSTPEPPQPQPQPETPTETPETTPTQTPTEVPATQTPEQTSNTEQQTPILRLAARKKLQTNPADQPTAQPAEELVAEPANENVEVPTTHVELTVSDVLEVESEEATSVEIPEETTTETTIVEETETTKDPVETAEEALEEVVTPSEVAEDTIELNPEDKSDTTTEITEEGKDTTTESQETTTEEVTTEETPTEAVIEETTPEEETEQEPSPVVEPVEETTPNVEPVEETAPVVAPVEEPEVDPFADLEESAKTYLDNLRKQQPSIVASIFADMVYVKGGHFIMGSDPQPTNDILDQDGKTRGMVEQNESPKHEVSLQSYYIGKYPINQRLWTLIMGYNPSEVKDDSFPVAPVNWHESQKFILRVSYLTGTMFHMPTEAQWEYAARGGEKSKGTTFAGSNTFSEVGWSDYKHPIGTKKPNELGIYDMSGLVREWCSDLWGHYPDTLQVDPTGPTEDSPLIILNTEGRLCRAVRSPYGNETVTNRKGETPDLDKEFKSYGIRIACYEIPKKAEQEDNSTVVPPKKTPRPLDPTQEPVLMAKCYYTGFYNSRKDPLPPEARACAYAMLHKYGYKQRQAEGHRTQPYGWRDTALLSSLVYTVIYLLLYIVNTGVYQFPLVGFDILTALVMTAFYFVIWAIIRFIKVDSIEQGNSFQPQLDMFNKNLSIKWMNVSILILSVLATIFGIVLTIFSDYDLLPLAWVIAIGTLINMTLPYANRKWTIKTDLSNPNDEDEEVEDEEEEVPNPTGDISRNYDWELDEKYPSGKQLHGSLTLYFSNSQVKATRFVNPFFSQRSDVSKKDRVIEMFHFLKEHKIHLARTRYIAYAIKELAAKNHLSPLDLIQFTLDFVQEPNIAFLANKDNKEVNYLESYIAYPDEILYDKAGDHNSKALLAAMIFHCMKYNVLYLISTTHQHAAIGVEVKSSDLENGYYGNIENLKNNLIKYNEKLYIFCETTNDHFVLGCPYDGMKIDEFEEKILLPLTEDDVEEQDEVDLDDIHNRVYEWKLDSDTGNTLTGSFAMEFSQKEIDHLREINPFRTYGKDQHTYEDNIRSIFAYLDSNPNHTKHLRALASYIKTSIEAAKLTDLDKHQFALDFVQEPNIKYCIDEESAGIEFAKEYMRIPDETLFDKEGDCDCKSALATALFRAMGKDVLYLISVKLAHAAIAIECNDEWLQYIKPADESKVICEQEGKRFIICETTGDGFRIGHIKDGDSIQDFETKIYLPI